MSTALVLDEISSLLSHMVATSLNGLLTSADIVIKSPQNISADKIGIYIYHLNRSPHFVNEPPERVSPGNYRRPLLVVEAGLVIYSTFADSRQELNYMENIADGFFRSPFMIQTDGAFENQVKIIPKTMGLDELNKFWSMFPGKSQVMAHFYQLAPVFVFPKTDIIDKSPEVQPHENSQKPKIEITTQILNEE